MSLSTIRTVKITRDNTVKRDNFLKVAHTLLWVNPSKKSLINVSRMGLLHSKNQNHMTQDNSNQHGGMTMHFANTIKPKGIQPLTVDN